MYVAKTKVLIRCMVTTQLICAFVFAYAKSKFSRDVARIKVKECIMKLILKNKINSYENKRSLNLILLISFMVSRICQSFCCLLTGMLY